MLKLIIFLGFIFSGLNAFSCDEPSDKYLYNFLNYKRPPSTWQTVKGKTFRKNRSINVLAVVERYLEDSYAVYKGDKYTYEEHARDVRICVLSSNKIRVIHPEHGSGTVTRTGNGDEAVLTGRKGIFTVRARPRHVVED